VLCHFPENNGLLSIFIYSFQPFVHSFVSFEILPLVEFQLEEGITDKEALLLIESSPKSYANETGK
jgi:intraflagellar transport protein 122